MRNFLKGTMLNDTKARAIFINLALVAAVATGAAMAFTAGSSSYGVKMLPAQDVHNMYSTVSLPTMWFE